MRRILVLVVCLLLAFGSVSPASAALPVEEAGLLEGGQPYEINPYGANELWISDWGTSSGTTGKVISVNTDNPNMVIYPVPGLPTDARRDGNYFWWVDGDIGMIGRAEVGTEDVTSVAYSTWLIPDVGNYYPSFYGSMVDASGRLWATDASYPRFYKLTVDQIGQPDVLCTYFLPEPSTAFSSYLAYKHPDLWIGDYGNAILYRLNVENNTFSSWLLPELSSPTGMVVDAEGDLWYADWYYSVVAELDPDSGGGQGNLASYPIGSNLTAMMVAVEGSRIWFTGENSPVIGILNPATAVHTDLPLTPTTGSFTPECTPLERSTDSLERITTPITWGTPPDYPLSYLNSGLQIYRISPGDLVDSSPWGIANQAGLMWVVDSWRQKLIKISPPPDIIPNFVYLPLIKR